MKNNQERKTVAKCRKVPKKTDFRCYKGYAKKKLKKLCLDK